MKSGSLLEKLLSQGEFVVCGELGPPQSSDPAAVVKKVAYFKGFVDAVNLTDNQTAIVRMSSIASAKLVLDQGLEPIIQMTCRDRNRIGMQSDILGAAGLGIKNILCLSGDHQTFGNHPQSKNVYDLDGVQLIQMVKQMRDDKKFQCGEEMKSGEPRMFIGGAANPFGDPFEFRVVRLAKKAAAGADFVQTQAIYDLKRFERFMELVRERELHKQVAIIGGVLPVRSVKALTYMRDGVPGMIVPEEYVTRMANAADPKEEGVKICVEMIQALRNIEGVAGVHIMPVMWESITSTIVEKAGLLPRPVAKEEAAKDSGEN